MSKQPSEGSGHWNRTGRRGGGSRPVHLPGARADSAAPVLSIQCFEGWHGECLGTCKPFMPRPCGCQCHVRRDEQ